MDPVDQLAFVVGLAEFDFQTLLGGAALAEGFDVGEGFVAVGGRFAGAQHVQVGTVEDEDKVRHARALHCCFCHRT
ncbi:hypothetical protein D3C75_1198730 [compost metagenome]